jgi:putative acetyltransferase
VIVAGALLESDSVLILRPAADRDAQDLFGLLALCFAEYPGCFIDPHDDLPDLRTPASSFGEKNGAFWVTEDDRGRVCACVAVSFPEPGTAELHRLYVRPDQRGNGVGGSLVRRVERHARLHEARRILLWSDARFTNAHRLYQRLGYTMAGERHLGDISNSMEYGFEKDL